MSTLTFETHEQAMACLNCGLAGYVPEPHFPMESGLWDEGCPGCGAHMVWVTEVRRREQEPAADEARKGPEGGE